MKRRLKTLQAVDKTVDNLKNGSKQVIILQSRKKGAWQKSKEAVLSPVEVLKKSEIGNPTRQHPKASQRSNLPP
jgi:hypothetical protein